ncbi:hypothetical protein UCRPA7_2233 [Phaeoacremonium minimum UCRPA7]|uniref:Uncharacterized protein n=1 Tax=Phaeoacremonium minimum (strain UCR-PA7) TaxID=1286976 RepID=R8BSJ2_PHAM7|nr:hypothetical protein UCRPA7_2233 [Phaeoacremonium minimum UCRPA7]EOO02265.1 hypothetical protein UCRPA7_2233 [Phaeoacremonium minimum UCRPA7]
MSNKSFRHVIKAGGSALEAATRPSFSQQRCFSISAAKQAGHVITFSPTSSPELDSVLDTIRHKILLPTYIRPEQRKKIFRPRYAKELKSNPITMEIDGEVIKFYGMDPTKGDIPNTRKILFEAIDKMVTREDWSNLPHLLEGLYYNANRKLLPEDYPKMTRKAGVKGQTYTIIECARQVKKTGFRLDTSEKVQELLSWVQLMAIDAEMDPEVTKKALTWSELVLEMLEDKQHQPKRKDEVFLKRFPLNRDPQILSVPLFLSASLAASQPGDEEIIEKVTKYAKDIVNLWPADKGLMELHPAESYEDKCGVQYLVLKNKLLTDIGEGTGVKE